MISKCYLVLTWNSMCSLFERLPCQCTSLLSQPRGCQAVCTAAPSNAGHRSCVKSQLELGGLTWAGSGREAVQQEHHRDPAGQHSPAVAADTSVLQLLHSQDLGKLLLKDRQGLLLSCQENVTRKQPNTPSPVMFSSHLFSAISENYLQKALLKPLSLQLDN